MPTLAPMPQAEELPPGNLTGDRLVLIWDGTAWVPTVTPAPQPIAPEKILDQPPTASPRPPEDWFAIDAGDLGTRKTLLQDIAKKILPPGNIDGDIPVWDEDLQQWVPQQPPPVVPTLPPAPPANLVATPGHQQISFTWTASSGASSYTLKGSTSPSGPFTTVQSGITGLNYTRTGLTNGTTYYHVVTAANANGESSNSNVTSATPIAPVSSKTVYWGRSAAEHLTNSGEVTDLSSSSPEIDYTRSYPMGSTTPNPGNYAFIALPASFGGPTSPNGIMFGAFPSAMADNSVGYGTALINGYSVEVVSVSGENYNIYRTYNKTAGDMTLTMP